MQIKHYDALKEPFGADRASGKRSSSFRQRVTELQDNIDLNDSHDDISMREPDVGVFDEGLSTPDVDSTYAQSHQSTWTSGSRGTKRKAPMIDLVEAQLEKMSSGFGLVADALSVGNCISGKIHDLAERHVVIAERQVAVVVIRNEIYQDQLTIIQRSRSRVYTEAEVWDMLTESNVIEPCRMRCFEFLCTNEQKRMLFGIPAHMCLQILCQMMNDHSGH